MKKWKGNGKEIFFNYGFDVFVLIFGVMVNSFLILYTNWIRSLGGDNLLTRSLYILVSEAIQNHELPLWNPYLFGGVSNIGEPITMAAYPINWFFCFLFSHDGTEYVEYGINFALQITHLTLYYYGVYLLLKKIQIRNYFAFLIAILSVTNASNAHFWTWIMLYGSVAYLPLTSRVCIDLLEAETPKRVALLISVLAAVFALQASLGISQMLVVDVVIILLLCLVWGIYHKKILHAFLKVMSAGITGIILVLFPIVEVLRFSGSAVRYADGWITATEAVPFSVFTANILYPTDLQALFAFKQAYAWLSIGGVILTFGIAGFFASKWATGEKRPIYIWSCGGVVVTLLCCFCLIITDIIYYIPGVNVLREAYVYSLYFSFFSVIVAGFGIEAFSSHNIKFERQMLGILSILILYNFVPHRFCRENAILSALIILFAVATLSNRCKILTYSILTCLVVANFQMFYNVFNTGYMNAFDAIGNVLRIDKHNKAEFESLHLDDDTERIISFGIESFPPNQTEVLRIRDGFASLNPIPRRNELLHDFIYYNKRAQLQNIRYFLVNPEIEDAGFVPWVDTFPWLRRHSDTLKLCTSYEDPEKTSDILVYEVAFGNRSAWTINNVIDSSQMTEEALFDWINSDETDLYSVGAIDFSGVSQETLSLLSGVMNNNKENAHENIRLKKTTLNEQTYEIEAESACVFVSAEMYEDGWTVYVDGKSEELLCVDYFDRGVVLAEGAHTVTFRYCPKSFWICTVLQTVAAICVICAPYVVNQKVKHSKELEKSLNAPLQE